MKLRRHKVALFGKRCVSGLRVRNIVTKRSWSVAVSVANKEEERRYDELLAATCNSAACRGVAWLRSQP